MADSRVVVYISSKTELGQVLREAAETGEPFIIDTDDAQYEIDIHARLDAVNPEERDDPDAIDDGLPDEQAEGDDPLLSIIGIFASGEPNNDVAQNKYRYLAEAYLSERA